MRSVLRSARLSSVFLLAAVITLVGVVTAGRIYGGWIPYDEGVMAQSAERVMLGELPHRDFDELWTGGVSEMHALAFRAFGPSLRTIRTVLLGSFLLSLVPLFAASRRLTGPVAAAGVTLLGAAWSVAYWPLPLPSWYVLFAELFGLVAMLAFLDTRRRRWLVLAGVCVGVSLVVKIVGLYFLAAMLFGLAFLVQVEVAVEPAPAEAQAVRTPWRLSPVTAACVAFFVLVVVLTRPLDGIGPVVHYLVPSAALCGVLVLGELRAHHSAGRRLQRLFALTWPLLAGAAIPVALFLVPYVRSGSLPALLRGVFVSPQVRFDVHQYPLPGLRTSVVALLPFAALLAGSCLLTQPLRRRDHIALGLSTALALYASSDGSPFVLVVWNAMRLATPALVVVGAAMLARRAREGSTGGNDARLFFLLSAAAFCSFIQIPFALNTYFLYFAPIAMLAATALLVESRRVPREVLVALLAFLVMFGVRRPDAIGPRGNSAGDPPATLPLPRGGLTVTRSDSVAYARLDSVVRAHAGAWIYVWHDSPEVYFLTGRRNPTRTMFETFDDSITRSPAHLERQLAQRDVRVVVLHDATPAIRPLDPGVGAWIQAMYPEGTRVAEFEVRWRRAPLLAP